MNISKAENIVPKGTYCYTILKIKFDKMKVKPPLIKTKNCKYFSNSYCALMQEEVEDQVKICGINDEI